MTVSVVQTPWASVWRKVAANAAMNPVTALLGYTNSELLADLAASRVADGLAAEVARVAARTGMLSQGGLSEDEARRAWRDIATLTGANRSSMLQDVQAGRADGDRCDLRRGASRGRATRRRRTAQSGDDRSS